MRQYANITVIGRDKTGVIAKVTHYLFQQAANIEALEEQVTRGQFSMTIQASWAPRTFDPEVLAKGLTELGRELNMEVRLRFTRPHTRQRMAVFVTRERHCYEGLIKACRQGRLKADPVVVISNHTELKPAAREQGIPFRHIPWNNRVTAEEKALKILDQFEVDFVVLARFMKILSPNFAWRYKNKIINIHPSLLPSFPGAQAYRQAYEHGVKILGVTAHFVSMHLDEGPIITQDSFKLRPNMSLKQIIATGQALETRTLIRAVRLYLTRRLDVHWGVVKEV